MSRESYLKHIVSHYFGNWGGNPIFKQWGEGPISQLDGFQVLEFAPSARRALWGYATCGMSDEKDENPIEVHLFASAKDEGNVELLTMLAYFHRTAAWLDLGHRVKFGRPWVPGSLCDRAYLSLPYLDGPNLEWLCLDSKHTRNLWLIPITAPESQYVDTHGLDALEELFESANFNYANPHRASLV